MGGIAYFNRVPADSMLIRFEGTGVRPYNLIRHYKIMKPNYQTAENKQREVGEVVERNIRALLERRREHEKKKTLEDSGRGPGRNAGTHRRGSGRLAERLHPSG